MEQQDLPLHAPRRPLQLQQRLFGRRLNPLSPFFTQRPSQQGGVGALKRRVEFQQPFIFIYLFCPPRILSPAFKKGCSSVGQRCEHCDRRHHK